MFSYLVLAAAIFHVLSAGTDRLSQLEKRLEHLQDEVHSLKNKVSDQQYEIDTQRAALAEKSREMADLRVVLSKSINLKSNEAPSAKTLVPLKRRFVLDADDVAFFARLDEGELTGVAQNQTILFDNIVVNAGNAFNLKAGVFTAPVDGFYFLSVAVASDLGHNHQLQVALMKNNDMLAIAHAHGDSGHIDQGGVSIVVGLVSGDKVYVKSTYQDVTDFYGGGLTTFSGFHIMFK